MSLHCRSHDRVPATTALLALLALVAMVVPSLNDRATAMQHSPDRLRPDVRTGHAGCNIARNLDRSAKGPTLTTGAWGSATRLFLPASQAVGCAYQRDDGDAPVREASRVHYAGAAADALRMSFEG